MAKDGIDYELRGIERQFVEVEMVPGEADIGEGGRLRFMEWGVQMDKAFGDGWGP